MEKNYRIINFRGPGGGFDPGEFVTKEDLTTLLAAKQDVINDLSTIRSGSAAGATAVQPASIADMEVTTNKVTSWQSTPDNTHYPSEKLVKDSIDVLPRYRDVVEQTGNPVCDGTAETIGSTTVYPSTTTYTVKPNQKITLEDSVGTNTLYLIDATDSSNKSILATGKTSLIWNNIGNNNAVIEVAASASTGQTLSVSIANSGVDKFVEVQYGKTRFNTVEALVEAGYIPYVKKQQGNEEPLLLIFSGYTKISVGHSYTKIYFSSFVDSGGNTPVLYLAALAQVDNAWTIVSLTPERTDRRINVIPGHISTIYYPSTKAVADYAEAKANKVISISSSSTDTQYPSAKAVYDFVGGALSKYVEHGTDDTTFMLTPNCFHIWGEVTALTLTLPSLLLPGYEFVFQFTSGATATALSLPSSLKWFTPHTVKDRTLYQVRILNGCASMQGVDISLAGDPYVDLGLQSGVKWAKRNIDITRDSGFTSSDYEYNCSFFSWGNIDGHNPTSDSSFSPWNWGSVNGSEPWYEGQVYGSTPGNTLTGNIPVGAEYDAARAILGSPWRMPTFSEYKELFDNTIFLDANGDVIPASTTNKLVTIEGIVGIRLASKINGNELFFPCSGYGSGASRSSRGSSGYYWSSTWLSARLARYLSFNSGGVNPQNDSYRYLGFAVRAVQ